MMRLKSARPAEGVRWMLSGVQLLLRYPLAHLATASMMSLLMVLLLALPWIGTVLAFVLLPALTVGWVASSATAASGRTPAPWLLFMGLRSPRRGALLHLGAVYAVLALGMLMLADLLDPGFQEQWSALVMSSRSGEDGAPGAGLMDAVQRGALLRAGLLVPLALAFWHAPIIVMQAGAGVAKALFGSIVATGRNLLTFIVYGLSWLAADIAFSTVLALLLVVLGLGNVAMLVIMPFAMLFMAAFYASLRASVAGCIDFENAEVSPPAPPDPPAEADAA